MKSYSHSTREATTRAGHDPKSLPLSWHNLLHSKGEKCWHEPTKPKAKKEERPDIKQEACAEHLREGDVS